MAELAARIEPRKDLRLSSLIVLALISITVIFFNGFLRLFEEWQRDDYSHGFMIPFVAVLFFLQRLPVLRTVTWRPAIWSVGLLVIAMLGWLLGTLSSLFIIVHYSLVLAIIALGLAVIGTRGVALTWAAFAYLIFMIPLPNFLYNNLSQELQLLSSQIGVGVVRLFGISVYLEGNVIDLGTFKLQVVEACSGLRYLFPLMSFGFLIGYLYQGPLWQRVVLFLSTMPITILMNSFRIGVIGVAVEHWGIEMAEGFLHAFEGWFIFMACVGVLVLEIMLFRAFASKQVALIDMLDLGFPTVAELRGDPAVPLTRSLKPAMLSVLILLAFVPVALLIENREEAAQERISFTRFPLLHSGWLGREQSLGANVLEGLKLTDYIVADYGHMEFRQPVNLYVAYYGSQRSGASAHSPRSCIPGDGWEIKSLQKVNLAEALQMNLAGSPFEANRVLIQKGEYKQLVYYWFQQRGRVITNEYAVKWYIFRDALTRNRTDGALVRLVVPVPPDSDEAAADRQLQAFLRDFQPLLARYIPD